MTFNLIAQELQQVGDEQRNGEAQNQCYQQDDSCLRTHLATESRLVDKATFICSSSQ